MKDLEGKKIEFPAAVNAVNFKDDAVVIKLTASIDKVNLNELAQMQKTGIVASLMNMQTEMIDEKNDTNNH